MKNYLWRPKLLVVNMYILDAVKFFHMVPDVRDFNESVLKRVLLKVTSQKLQSLDNKVSDLAIHVE